MALVPHKIVALNELNEGAKNTISGAVVSLFDTEGNAVTLFDDESGANGSTAKQTDSEGVVVVYVTPGEYDEQVNGGIQRRVLVGNKELTTEQLIERIRKARDGDVITTTGFSAGGDGGAAQWKATSTTGLIPSQTPADRAAAELVDGSGRLWELVGDEVSLSSLGAVGDGAYDNWGEYRATLRACSSSGKVMIVPKGEFFVDTTLGGLTLLGSLRMKGFGAESKIVRKEVTGSLSLAILVNPSSNSIENVEISGVNFKGQYGEGSEQVKTTYMLLFNVKNLEVRNCQFNNIGSLCATAVSCENVKMTNNTLRNVARDGLRAVACRSVNISNNYAWRVHDDAIAVHTDPEYAIDGITDTNITIIGNNLVESQGIAVLGGQNVTITGNSLLRCNTRGICVILSLVEGKNTIHSVIINGNSIVDMMPRVYTTNDGSTYDFRPLLDNSYVPYIAVSNPFNGATYASGEIGANGYPLQPYGLYSITDNSSEANIATGDGITISDNVMKRTMPYGVLFSSLGYGELWNQYGISFDGQVTSEAWNTVGVALGGKIATAKVFGNTFSGICEGVGLKEAINDEGSGYIDNLDISDNTFFDIQRAAISNYSERDAVSYTVGNLTIKDNNFNLDPFYLGAEDYDQEAAVGVKMRRDDGSWAISSVISSDFNVRSVFVSRGDIGGMITYKGNEIKNVSAIYANNAEAGTIPNASNIVFKNNTLHIGLNSVGSTFADANKGIASLDTFLFSNEHVYYDADVTSPAFNEAQDSVYTSGLIPSTGFYAKGFVLKRSNPDSSYEYEWLRVTTGTGHVLGTDWISINAN